jgi:hypothetical protein
MDRAAFEHLYLHANSIAALGMRRAVARLMAMRPPTETAPGIPAFAAGVDTDMSHPESFDWSVYDGIDEEVAALGRQREEALAANLPFFDQCVAMAEEDETEAGDGMPDVARYLAGVDHGVLASALGKLPARLAPLTATLWADNLEGWLVLYETGDENLLKVVEETRRHEPLP